MQNEEWPIKLYKLLRFVESRYVQSLDKVLVNVKKKIPNIYKNHIFNFFLL